MENFLTLGFWRHDQTWCGDPSIEDIILANDVVKSLITGVMKYLKVHPSDVVLAQPRRATWPPSENELIQMLLLNIFDGCAMTYRGCEAHEIGKINGEESSIAGQPSTRYCTGSSYEGIGCASKTEHSDLDMMYVLDNFKVNISSENEKWAQGIGTTADGNKNDNEGVYRASSVNLFDIKTTPDQKERKPTFVKTDGNPGVTGIQTVNTTKSRFPGYISLVADKNEMALKETIKSLNYGPVIRRESVNKIWTRTFDYDEAIAVECNIWPVEALDWYTRPRLSNWPDRTLIEQCRRTPCYIVRKPHATNLNDVHEWRFSFARHEAMLLRSLTVETKMIYILTKVLLKASALQDSCLTTYHLKTLFLWFLEKHSVDKFDSDAIGDSVHLFLSFVLLHIKDHTVRNYFIPENNMISHVPQHDLEKVEKQVERILVNFTSALAAVNTAHVYPFSTKVIAEHITENSSMRTRCMAMLQSNFENIIIKHLFCFYWPHWNVVWMYWKRLTMRVQGFDKETRDKQAAIPEVLRLLTEIRLKLHVVYRVYGNEFIKLGMLYCNYLNQELPEVYFHYVLLLKRLFQLPSEKCTLDCMATVTCTISMRHGESATKECCNLWKNVLTPGKCTAKFYQVTHNQVLTYKLGWDMDDHTKMSNLIGCLNSVFDTLQLRRDDIDVRELSGTFPTPPRHYGNLHNACDNFEFGLNEWCIRNPYFLITDKKNQ